MMLPDMVQNMRHLDDCPRRQGVFFSQPQLNPPVLEVFRTRRLQSLMLKRQHLTRVAELDQMDSFHSDFHIDHTLTSSSYRVVAVPQFRC